MADAFDQMQKFYKALERLSNQNRSMFTMIEKLGEAARQAVRIDMTLAAVDALRNLGLTSYQHDLIASMNPSSADLQIYRIHQLFLNTTYRETRNYVPQESKVFAQIAQQETLWRTSMQGMLAQTSAMESLARSTQRTLFAQEIAQLKIVESLRNYEVFDKCDSLACRLMVPQQVFADFASGTVARLAQETSSLASSALRASLRLAEAQLITTSDIVSRALGNANISAFSPVIENEPILVLPNIQQQELLQAGVEFSEEDLDLALNASPAAQIADLTRKVLSSVTQCNEASRVAGKEEVFKPTNRILEAFAQLPWDLATDKRQLSDVVDYLFWILYEGAGDDSLRFLKDSGGWMDATECEVVFRVKYLRNKWLRHDPDHGSESKVERTWRDVADVLRGLGLTRLPVSRSEFHALQRTLLQQVESFLQILLSRIGGGRS